MNKDDLADSSVCHQVVSLLLDDTELEAKVRERLEAEAGADQQQPAANNKKRRSRPDSSGGGGGAKRAKAQERLPMKQREKGGGRRGRPKGAFPPPRGPKSAVAAKGAAVARPNGLTGGLCRGGGGPETFGFYTQV